MQHCLANYATLFSILVLSFLPNHSFWHKNLLICIKKENTRNLYSTTWNIYYVAAGYSGVDVPNRFCHHEKSLFKTIEKCSIHHCLRIFCVSINGTQQVSLHGSCVPFILPSSFVDVSFWDSSFWGFGVVSIFSFSSSFEVGTTSFRKNSIDLRQIPQNMSFSRDCQRLRLWSWFNLSTLYQQLERL